MNNNEPVVLGKIKKGKTGKPLVVLIVFLFAGAFVLFLPTISSYFGDNNIIDLIKNGEIVDFFINHDNYVNNPIINKTTTTKVKENENKLINNKTIIEYSNLILNNFKLTTQDISFKVNISNNANLDDSNYYLVLEKDNKDIEYIKLISGDNSFKFINELDNTIEIKGYVKIFKESEYPKFSLSSDETGTASLYCNNDNFRYEYIFNNNLLVSVKETYNYNNDNLDEYYIEYQNYSNKVNLINQNNGVSSIIETFDGFTFSSEIDLNIYSGTLAKNYYSLNTKSNKINFEMKAKGYDCK